MSSVDLMTVAGMAHFASSFVERFGMERLEGLLAVSERLGRIDPERKELVLTLGQLFEDGTGSTPTARGLIALLAQLDGLAGSTTPADVRVLPYLLHDDAFVDALLSGNGPARRSGNGSGNGSSNGVRVGRDGGIAD